eukprot:s357_g47.t3
MALAPSWLPQAPVVHALRARLHPQASRKDAGRSFLCTSAASLLLQIAKVGQRRCTRRNCLQNVRRIRLEEKELIGFKEDFFQVFKHEEDFLWNALKDPLSTEKAVARSFKLVVKWLPEEALLELLRFFVDARAAPAIWISGLALDDDIPATPALPGDFRLPVSEAWLLGLARCLGIPYGMLGFYSDNARGGLIRDLSPKPGLGGINQPHINLGLHRDVPACVSGGTEPDGFILLAARGDPQHAALTRICSSQLLLKHLNDKQITALRRSPVRTQCVRTSGISPYGKPFYAIKGEEPTVTFFYIPDHQDFSYEIVSDDKETEAAYHEALKLATELSDGVDLQAGDALVINNSRCNHGRTAFEPQLDGSDRWLLKTFISAGGWQRPGQAAPLVWPSLLLKPYTVDNFERTRQEAPRKERAHARRSERPVARGKEEGGVPKAQKDDQQTPFMTYMAALRDSHGELEDAKEKPERKRHGGDNNMKTLRAVCADRPTLATSHSLPALPKGRSIYQVEDGVSPNKAAMFSSFS